MVRHREGARSYLTLPGGGIEPGESPAEAAVRELEEEAGLRAKVVGLLAETACGPNGSVEFIFLLEVESGTETDAALGYDPEEQHLPQSLRLLQGVEWRDLDDLRLDRQVRIVLDALADRI